MSVKFDDNTVSHWNIAKKTTYTYQNGIVAAVEGFHTEGTNTKIAEWGTTRFAQSFTTTINEPLVVRQDCSFRVTGGQVTYSGFIDASVTFGLDATGTPTSCPGTGHYYYKVIWTGPNGTSLTVIAPY